VADSLLGSIDRCLTSAWAAPGAAGASAGAAGAAAGGAFLMTFSVTSITIARQQLNSGWL